MRETGTCDFDRYPSLNCSGDHQERAPDISIRGLFHRGWPVLYVCFSSCELCVQLLCCAGLSHSKQIVAADSPNVQHVVGESSPIPF